MRTNQELIAESFSLEEKKWSDQILSHSVFMTFFSMEKMEKQKYPITDIALMDDMMLVINDMIDRKIIKSKNISYFFHKIPLIKNKSNPYHSKECIFILNRFKIYQLSLEQADIISLIFCQPAFKNFFTFTLLQQHNFLEKDNISSFGRYIIDCLIN